MINFDGNLLEKNSFYLNGYNRGFRAGDMLYEEVKAVNGKLYFWEDHFLKLMASMRILRMEIPMQFTMEFLEEEINSLLNSNNFETTTALIRISVFRKNGSGILPEDQEISYLIETEGTKNPFYLLSDDAYEIELFKDFYINADFLSTLNTNNKMLRVVGRIYAKENGYQDCLLLNTSKNVVAALEGNIFLISGKVVKTPPLAEGCPDTVLRQKLIEIVQKYDELTLEEVPISPFELQKADEIFISHVRVGIQPVTKYRKAVYGSGVAVKLIGKLNAQARLT